MSQYYRLALTEVNELNLPADPCNTDPDNRFHDCIRRNVSGQVSPKEIYFGGVTFLGGMSDQVGQVE